MSEEQWMEVCNTVPEVVSKTIPKKKKCKKAKLLSEEALQKAKETGKDIPNWKQSANAMGKT